MPGKRQNIDMPTRLANLGFKPAHHAGAARWRFSGDAVSVVQTAKETTGSWRAITPWTLVAWDIAGAEEHFRHRGLRLYLNIPAYQDALTASLRQNTGWGIASIDHARDRRGRHWLLLAFASGDVTSAGRDVLPVGGMIGVCYQMVADRQDLVLAIADSFALGDVPEGAIASGIDLLTRSASGAGRYTPAWDIRSVFEARLSAVRVAASLLGAKDEDVEALDAMESFHPVCATLPARDRTGLSFEFGEMPEALPQNSGEKLRLVPSLGLLESREIVSIHDGLERQLVRGERVAESALQERMLVPRDRLYMLRRICLAVAKPSSEVWADLVRGVRDEPTCLLLRSALIQALFAIDRCAEALPHLSELTRQLLSDVTAFEELPTSRYVIPAMLGLGWEGRDWRQAQACYERMLAATGEMPQVLLRLSRLVKAANEPALEQRYLDRYVAVERRRKFLSEAHLRLAGLAVELQADIERASVHARESLAQDPSSANAAILSCDLLVEQKRPEEAVELLTSTIEAQRADLSADDLLKLEERLAELWRRELHRPDMAELRLRRLQSERGTKQANAQLQRLYRETNEFSKLADVLEESLNELLAIQNQAQVRQVWGEYKAIILEKLTDPNRAARMLTSLAEHRCEVMEDLEDAKRWLLNAEAWQSVVDAFTTSTDVLEDTLEQHRRYETLARVCWEYLSDDGLAEKLVEKASAVGLVDRTLFYRVLDTMSAQKQFQRVAALCSVRLSQVGIEERRDLGMRLLRLPQGADAGMLDRIAIQLFEENPDDESPVQMRLVAYSQRGLFADFENFLQQVVARSQIEMRRRHWLEQAADVLQENGEQCPPELLAKVMLQQVEVADDSNEVARKALSTLLKRRAYSQAKPFVLRLMAGGVLPELTMDQALHIMSARSRDLGVFHWLSALKSASPQAAKHAREGLEILMTFDDGAEKSLDCLDVLSQKVELSDRDLSLLDRLCVDAVTFEHAVRVLRVQAELAQDERRRQKIWLRLAELGERQKEAQDVVVQAYEQAVESGAESLAVLRRWAEAARLFARGDKPQDMRPWVRMLSVPRLYRDDDQAIEAIRAAAEGGEWTAAHHAIDMWFAKMAESSAWERLLEVDRKVRDLRLGGSVAAGHALAAALHLRDQFSSSHWVLRGLEFLKSSEDFQSYWSSTLEAIGAMHMDYIVPIIEADLVRAAALRENLPVGWYEALVWIGLRYFQQGSTGDEGVQALTMAIEEKNQDERLWMPLYFMLRERQMREPLLVHLRRILPMVVKNPESLLDYPVTFESLREEFRALQEGVPLREPVLANAKVAGEFPMPPSGDAPRPKLRALIHQPSLPAPPKLSARKGHLREEIVAPLSKLPESINPRLRDVVPAEVAKPSSAPKAAVQLPAEFSDASAPEDTADSETKSGSPELDWRVSAISQDWPRGAVTRLLQQAFASATEKHVAVQVAALSVGDLGALRDWQWPVWRTMSAEFYPFEAKARYPKEDGFALINSSLHRFIYAISPILVQVFRDRFSLDYLLRRLGGSPEALNRQRRQVPWSDANVCGGAMMRFADGLKEQRFQLFDLPGLKEELFYDGSQRSLYCDLAHYASLPPTHLMHAILFMIQSVKNQYFIPLALNPRTQVFPVTLQIRQLLERTATERVRVALLGPRSPTEAAMRRMDEDDLRLRLDKIGRFSEERLIELWDAMRLQLYAKTLSETLDLVGMIEHLTARDLVNGPAIFPGEIFKLARLSALLMQFATRMRL